MQSTPQFPREQEQLPSETTESRTFMGSYLRFVVETAGRRIAPTASGAEPPYTQITLYDQPGLQSRSTTGSIGGGVGRIGVSPLVTDLGHNCVGVFAINFQNEVLRWYAACQMFDDAVEQNVRGISDDNGQHGLC